MNINWNDPNFVAMLQSPLYLGLAAGIVLILIAALWLALRPKKAPPIATRRDLDSVGSLPNTVSPDALQGGLQHMPLPDLLQFLAQGRRTGSLEISSGRRAGMIRMVLGMVVHAEYRRTEDLEALYGLLGMETGDFVFTPSAPPDYPVSGREVVDILMLWLSRKEVAR